MNRKKLIRIFVCIILVALIICLVPLPVWHNMTLQGSQVNKEGEVLGDATVKLRVWKLHYLFKANHVKGRDDYFKGSREGINYPIKINGDPPGSPFIVYIS